MWYINLFQLNSYEYQFKFRKKWCIYVFVKCVEGLVLLQKMTLIGPIELVFPLWVNSWDLKVQYRAPTLGVSGLFLWGRGMEEGEFIDMLIEWLFQLDGLSLLLRDMLCLVRWLEFTDWSKLLFFIPWNKGQHLCVDALVGSGAHDDSFWFLQ